MKGGNRQRGHLINYQHLSQLLGAVVLANPRGGDKKPTKKAPGTSFKGYGLPLCGRSSTVPYDSLSGQKHNPAPKRFSQKTRKDLQLVHRNVVGTLPLPSNCRVPDVFQHETLPKEKLAVYWPKRRSSELPTFWLTHGCNAATRSC